MTRHMRVVVVLALLVGSFGLAGCLKATGGGKFIGLEHGGSVTTGFQLRCDNVGSQAHVTGQFQYHDHGTDVAFHAVIDTLVADESGPVTCEALDQMAAAQGTFTTIGTYTPQPKNLGPGGQVQVTIQDQSNTFGFCGVDGVDGLVVQIATGDVYGDGGVYGNGGAWGPGPYLERGCLDKGNFTVFTE